MKEFFIIKNPKTGFYFDDFGDYSGSDPLDARRFDSIDQIKDIFSRINTIRQANGMDPQSSKKVCRVTIDVQDYEV